jgi:hypothetical protein
MVCKLSIAAGKRGSPAASVKDTSTKSRDFIDYCCGVGWRNKLPTPVCISLTLET